LVDYNRTASRAYIFTLLSLHDCPYEEIRYFVPFGGGEWSFDRQRKEAFDMKIRELETEVRDLKSDNARLQERLRKQKEHLETTEHERKQAKVEVGRISEQTRALQGVVEDLRVRHNQIEETNRQLQDSLHEQTERLTALEQQNETLNNESAEAHGETEAKRNEIAVLLSEKEDRQTQLAVLSKKNEQLINVVQEQRENAQTVASRNEALQSELNHLRDYASQERARLELEVATLQEENEAFKAELVMFQERVGKVQMLEDEIAIARAEINHLQSQLQQLDSELNTTTGEKTLHQEQVDVLRQKNIELSDKIARLEGCFEPAQRALRSPFGRGFTAFIRLWYGINLSELQQEGGQ
jgi:chromosome segregation ATPase